MTSPSDRPGLDVLEAMAALLVPEAHEAHVLAQLEEGLS